MKLDAELRIAGLVFLLLGHVWFGTIVFCTPTACGLIRKWRTQ